MTSSVLRTSSGGIRKMRVHSVRAPLGIVGALSRRTLDAVGLIPVATPPKAAQSPLSPATLRVLGLAPAPAVVDLTSDSSEPAVVDLASDSSEPAVVDLTSDSSEPAVVDLTSDSSEPAVVDLTSDSSEPGPFFVAKSSIRKIPVPGSSPIYRKHADGQWVAAHLKGDTVLHTGRVCRTSVDLVEVRAPQGGIANCGCSYCSK